MLVAVVFSLFYVITLMLGLLGILSTNVFLVVLTLILASNLLYNYIFEKGTEEMGEEFVEYDKLKEEARKWNMFLDKVENVLISISKELRKLQNSIYDRIYVLD